ncbi:DDE-domain-containing protein, partial [Wilcoxina mikolae CBS 423.85]
IGKNRITCFLNRHDVLATKFASRIDRQHAFSCIPRIILDHFRKCSKLIRNIYTKSRAITNMNEKGFIMGYSKKTKVITRRGRKYQKVKQHGTDEYVLPSFLIEKGKKHYIGWYRNVLFPKWWTDDELALWWLVNVNDPYSNQHCPGEKRLLILDGHGSHITADFMQYCENINIAVYCLPLHSTHLLQPLDVGLFAPLPSYYSKAVEYHFLITDISVNCDTFFPLFKKACKLAYTKDTIHNACLTGGIVPLH